MAETAASALLNVVFEKLANEAFKKYVRSQGIHSELKELGSTLSRIQDLLNDASHKEITEKSVKQWLNSLQHLAYDIDDILDDVATEAMHHELTQEPGASTSKVRKLIPTCCTKFSLSHRLSPKLDNITTQLQNLYKAKADLGLIVKDEKQKDPNRGNETCLPESNVVGRDVEKEKLLNKLLSGSPSKENFSIIPIVGMGGVGKTTLARLLYNDTKVKGHFDLKAWVCVSDDFDTFKISESIFQSVTRKNKEFKDLNQLQMALAEQFKDKRFLLVLDDVWTENYHHWEKLVRPFNLGAPGSTIIMTTRKDQLLQKQGLRDLYHLESLSHDDALSLFALHALGVDSFDSHPMLRPKGEGIVEKCGGLPLALKAIGRLLRAKAKTDGEDWDVVLKSEIWEIENADEIVPALRLSYHDLSADLKLLFAYCSLFPKDFLFDKEELILLWMAEGYLNQSGGYKSPERLGQECFEKLLSRSFFQPAPNNESLYVMHDLMNDLATFVAGDYFLRFDTHIDMGNEFMGKYRHMSFIREEYVGYPKFEAFKKAKSLRTFLAVDDVVDQRWKSFYISSKILAELLPKVPLLRVLSLSRFHLSEVPDFIGNLIHLRYLNLSQTKIKELPENVGNLYNLQTLIIFGCENLTKLPKSFLKLKKLRHFDIRDSPLLEKVPLGIGELKSLQTLTKIIIEKDGGFAITELKGLQNLHGEISIQGLCKVQSAMHAEGAKVALKGFTKLELDWGIGYEQGILDKEVLDKLKPDSDRLKELVVVSYGEIEFPNWIGDPSFHKLVHVSVRGCRKCTSLPPLGQLTSLKKLFIQGMDEVKFIGLELTGSNVVSFPSLQILEFEDMSGWEVWSTSSKVLDEVFPCLRELHIRNCPNLVDLSLDAMPSLRVLEIDGCSDSALTSLVRAASLITKLETRSISRLTDEVWRGVIEHLGTTEEVTMWSCNEIRYMWESEAKASKVLVNLKRLAVFDCANLVSLGEKEEVYFGSNPLSSLRMLCIVDCESMEHLCCPNSSSIETLLISSCSSLTRVSFSTTQGGGQNLRALVIEGCKKLMEKIDTSMPMLEKVTISGWMNLKSIIQLSEFIHLTELSIEDFPSIESFPDIELANLTRLTITNCPSIESFPHTKLPNLTSLRIRGCENLVSFQLSQLNLLKDLEIRNCPSIDASFICGLWPPKLLSLRIGRLKKPISEWGPLDFPSSFHNLRLFGEHVSNFSQLSHVPPSSLTRLCIDEFVNLESLSTGLQYLTSLRHLDIHKCPKMKHLPETLLPSLLSLRIVGCQNLQERCNGKGSHYWPLISHIPCIKIKITSSYFF